MKTNIPRQENKTNHIKEDVGEKKKSEVGDIGRVGQMPRMEEKK